MTQRATSRRMGTAAGLGAVFIWCWSAPALATGSRAFGCMTFLALASVVGVATGVVFRVMRGGSVRGLFLLPHRVAVASFFGVAVHTILLTLAVALAEERELGQVVLLNYLWPVWIILLSALLLPERPPLGPMLLAGALGFAGVTVSRGLEAFAWPSGSVLPHGLALAAGLLWSAYSVLLRRWRVPEESSGSTLPFVFCAVLALSIAAFTGELGTMPSLTPAALLWLGVYGVGAVGLGYALWELGMKRGHAELLAVSAYFIPVASSAIISLLFREAASVSLAVGAALITAGAVIAGRGGRRDQLS